MSDLLKQTDLYAVLEKKSKRDFARVLDATKFLSMIGTATDAMGDVLNRTCANFPDYTLHDEKHATRVIFLMYRIMGESLIDRLSPVDLALLILSAYGHDTGMAIGREQRDELLESEEYKGFLLHNEDRWLEAEHAREGGDVREADHLLSHLFQDFLRGRHHLQSAELMVGDFRSLLEVEGKSLAKPVADLCRSHGESVTQLACLGKFPFAGSFLSDLPFLACVLRLADYLDLDPARAPTSLMNLIKPGSEKSMREWRKHQANNIFVTDTQLKFAARFEDFFEEKALRDTLAGVESERAMCMEFLRARVEPDKLSLKLQAPIEVDIESVGYIYKEFQFRLEYKEIIALLMGTRLYRDERVFVRELLQNALDACRHAEAGAMTINGHTHAGRIVVRSYTTSSSQEVIEVSDNGSGMTLSIVRDYFMRVGRSYYQSFAFRRKAMDFHPVSQFGIGILSCFLNSDYIEVETRPDPITFQNDGDLEDTGWKLEIRGPHEFFVVRKLDDAPLGTTVRVFLKRPLTESLTSVVERFLCRTPYTVEIHDHAHPPTELTNRPFDFEDEQFAHCFVDMPGSFGYANRDLVFDGKLGFELKGRMRFFLLDARDRRYLQIRNAGKYSFVGFGHQGETLVNVERLTDEVRQQLNVQLNEVRLLSEHFSGACRTDLKAIEGCFDRICDHLMHGHASDDVTSLWSVLTSQIEALGKSEGFRSNPACINVNRHISAAVRELESFVTGEIRISLPSGVITQDGIDLGESVSLPSRIRLGIGFLYNLDLCGRYRLTLNAARDAIVFDDRFDTFVNYLHLKVGAFLGEWFRAEGIPREQLDRFVTSVPKELANATVRSYGGTATGNPE